MAINFKEKSIKYLNKDFLSFKRDLINFSLAHHSGVFLDFNESSPGMALLELNAYIGDVLSFYQDMMFDEMRGMHAQLIDVVTDFSRMLGYNPSGKRAATGPLAIMIEVPSVRQNNEYVPNDTYCPILRKGSKFGGPNGVVFETLSDVFFSASAPTESTTTIRQITGSQFDQVSGIPTYFAVRKDVIVTAGDTKTDTFTLGDFQKFVTVELANEDVIEVLSVTDSDGNDWVEVNYLAEETIFDTTDNVATDSSTVPYVMKLKAVPRRFITTRDPLTNKTTLTFGAGDGVNFDDELIPNVADFAIPTSAKTTINSYAIDPLNFLKTMTLGLSPYNTTLTVSYRSGGGQLTNVPPGAIKSVISANLEFSSTSLDPLIISSVRNSIECSNPEKTDGGGPAETIDEIIANRSAHFAAQNRIVTREDYLARVMSLPSKFGKIEKAFVTRDVANKNCINVHLLTRDEYGMLQQASTTLLGNIQSYLGKYRMMTDGVNLLKTNIINFAIDFGIVVSRKANRNQVLAKCLSAVRDLYSSTDASGLQVCNMQIGEPIVLDDIVREMKDIPGVISVYDLRIRNTFGSDGGFLYSTTRFDVLANSQLGIVYCPSNAIFELKFPKRDINGEAK